MATISDSVGGTWPGLNPSRWLWYAAQLESPLLWALQWKWLPLIHGEHRGSESPSHLPEVAQLGVGAMITSWGFLSLKAAPWLSIGITQEGALGDWCQRLVWRQASLFSKFPEESNLKTGFEDNFSDLKTDYLLQNFLGDVLTIQIPDSTPNPANQNRWVEAKDLHLASRESFSGNFLTHTHGILSTGVDLMPSSYFH